MSEYIIEVEYDTFNGTFTQMRHEEIVRCRDCIKWHMCDVNEDGSMRGSCDEWTHLDGFTHTTCENGFCAWASRKEGE